MADEATDLSDTIASAASGPAASTVDGVSVTERPLADLIAADKYLKQNAAANKVQRGLRFSKLIPPGSV